MSDDFPNGLTNEELWKLFPVTVAEYKNVWPLLFEKEKELLTEAAGRSTLCRISHIGSTAVPGLAAKPTIDILVEISSEADTCAVKENLEKKGYIFSCQPGKPPPHMMFMKGYTPLGFKGQAYHVHVRYPGDWDELYFRDYLIVNDDAAREYAALKKRLQKKFEFDRDGYTSAKTEFVSRINKLARKEFPDRYKI